MKRAALLLLSLTAFANRGEFLNSTGEDGHFHLTKDMYLCLNFSFDPGADVHNNSRLHGELLFNNYEGHDQLDKADACTPVTKKMIDHTNKVLDALAVTGPMKPGESRTIPLK